jgi:DNA-binding response OmpR family regulator
MSMWGRRRTLTELNHVLPREELVRRSRLLVIDDERPDIIDDLGSAGFSVDYRPDISRLTLNELELRRYDLVLLDFAGVGTSIGKEQGLSVLRYIKRVNPAIVVLAYTSKALMADHADFYRRADGVLSKDAGIGQSMESIEMALRKAHSVENQWQSLLTLCGIEPGSKHDLEWQDLLVRGTSSETALQTLRTAIGKILTSPSTYQIAVRLVEQLVRVGVGH